MQFKDVIGQENIKERLIKSVKNNRVSHAQLFFGGEGVGKLAIAIAYAQYINCENKSETDSCGECKSCKKINKLLHPDVNFVFPIINPSGKKYTSDTYIKEWREHVINTPYFTYNNWISQIDAENKQGIINIHESVSIYKKINFTAYEAEYKVMIIWLAEKMNLHTANKLLKILEEPPPKTVFLLITEDIESIISTIRSRTQPVKIPKINNIDLEQYLLTKHIDKSIQDIAIKYSNGNLIELNRFIENTEENKELFSLFVSFMRTCYKFNITDINNITQILSKLGREKQKRYLNLSIRLLRENFILNIDEDELTILNTDERNFSSKFSNFIHPGIIEELEAEFDKAHFDIGRNGAALIIFYDLGIKVNKLLRIKPE